MLKKPKTKTKIAVLVSGGGTNLQAIIDGVKRGKINSGEIVVVISNKEDAFALKRAEAAGIPHFAVKRSGVTKDEFEQKILEILEEYRTEFVVLAGFLCVLSENFVKRYENRIINVHPSLIPRFCGKGCYGLKVHEEVLKSGVPVTGATVHYVNAVADGGKIIYQKRVRVRKNDTPESLQLRVMKQAEWKLLPKAVEKISKGIAVGKEK